MLAQTESVFALSNGHIGLRGNLDEGEPHGLPGTYLNGFYELAPAALRRGRLRLPRGRPDRRQRHQRQADPPARRRRAVRRALRRAARPTSACSTCAPACCAGRCEWTSPAGTSGARPQHAARVVRPARGRRDPVTRSSRSARAQRPWSSSPSWSPTSRCRRRRRRPARGRRARVAAAVAEQLDRRTTGGRCSSTAPRPAACGWRPAMDHVIDGPDEATTTESRGTTTGARDASRPSSEPGERAAVRQVPRLRLVEPSAPCRRCATRSSAALAAARHTGWDGLLAAQRAYLDEFWDARRRRDRGRRRAPAGGAVRRCSTCSRPARGPSGGAIPAKGLTGPGYDGHAFWDTETFVLPVLTYTSPDAAARRAALAARDARAGPRPREAARPARARRSRGARSPGEECSGYWPAGTAAFHVNADIADAVAPLHAARPATRTSSATCGLELLVETARLWRSLGHHDARGRFRIDGVTGPTSTAPSPTTTSTPT